MMILHDAVNWGYTNIQLKHLYMIILHDAVNWGYTL
jgi:hypothetical protein